MQFTGRITIDTVKRFYANKEEGFKVAEETVKDLQERENSYTLSSRAGKMDWDRGNSGIRTLGLGISAEYIQKGFIDFRGKTIESPEQLALLAQVYRDPRYETLRIIYTKGDIIVGHEGITSRLPNASVAFFNVPNREETTSDEEYYRKCRQGQVRHFMGMLNRMERLDADGYFLLHNHPSAISIDPSEEDLKLTTVYKKSLAGFKGHIIINSNKYCFIDPDNNFSRYPLYLGEDLLTKPAVPHPLLGTVIDGPSILAQLGKAIQVSQHYSVIIYVTAKQQVRAIQEIPDGLLKKEKECVDYLRGRMRDFGSSRIFLVSPNESIYEIANDMVRKGYFLDAIITDNITRVNSVRESGVESPKDAMYNRWMGIYSLKSYRVSEKEYNYCQRLGDHDFR